MDDDRYTPVHVTFVDGAPPPNVSWDDDLHTRLQATRSAVSRQRERETGRPFGDPMTADEARKLTDRIKRDGEQMWHKIKEAYLGRADIALGYDSWDDYCITEFGSLRLRIPREERAEMVCSLRQSGLSNRAIASATGVSEGTVRNDQKSGAQNYAPDEDALTEQLIAGEPWFTPVIGRDGKTYTPPKPKPQPPPPSDAEMFETEMSKLNQAINVLSWLVSRATDAERDELAQLWADEIADYGKRLQVIAHKLRGLYGEDSE